MTTNWVLFFSESRRKNWSYAVYSDDFCNKESGKKSVQEVVRLFLSHYLQVGIQVFIHKIRSDTGIQSHQSLRSIILAIESTTTHPEKDTVHSTFFSNERCF